MRIQVSCLFIQKKIVSLYQPLLVISSSSCTHTHTHTHTHIYIYIYIYQLVCQYIRSKVRLRSNRYIKNVSKINLRERNIKYYLLANFSIESLSQYFHTHTHINIYIITGNGYRDPSSNPGPRCSYFTTRKTFGKDMNPDILPSRTRK